MPAGATPIIRPENEERCIRCQHCLAVCPQEDVNLALAYVELLSQSAGLGTVWCGLVKMAMELLPALKNELGLQPGRPYYTMLFSLPDVRYARTVQRDGADRTRPFQNAPISRLERLQT